jgi:flagellar biosynthesis chaperone FliJ
MREIEASVIDGTVIDVGKLQSDLERAYRKIAALEAENTRLNSELNQALLKHVLGG